MLSVVMSPRPVNTTLYCRHYAQLVALQLYHPHLARAPKPGHPYRFQLPSLVVECGIVTPSKQLKSIAQEISSLNWITIYSLHDHHRLMSMTLETLSILCISFMVLSTMLLNENPEIVCKTYSNMRHLLVICAR